MKFKDVKVGDTVVVERYDHRGFVESLDTMQVSKVGTKYFYVPQWIGSNHLIRFNKQDGKQETEYGYKDIAYLTQQDLDDKNEAIAINHTLYNQFNSLGRGRVNLSLDQLRRIKAILDEPTNPST